MNSCDGEINIKGWSFVYKYYKILCFYKYKKNKKGGNFYV